MQKRRAWLIASTVLITIAAGCGSPGTVETHRIKGSEMPAPPKDAAAEAAADADGGDEATALPACPDGWSCMDIAATGFMATDGDGKPVAASCSKGAPIACDDSDPAASCEGLSEPFCAHLKVGAQDIVSCAQRCKP